MTAPAPGGGERTRHAVVWLQLPAGETASAYARWWAVVALVLAAVTRLLA